MSDYLSPSASNYADLSAKVRKTIPPESELHLHYAAMKKYDGVSGIVDLAAGTMTSRTGEDYSVSCAHIISQCIGIFGEEGKVYGEVWHPTLPQSTISGDFRRQSSGVAEHLKFVVFDIFFDRSDDPGQAGRYAAILEYLYGNPCDIIAADYFNPGTYGTGKQLMETYMPGGGYDGIVYYDPNALFEVGKNKSGTIIKEKPSVTFDLEVVSFNYGKGRHANRIGALVMRFKEGKTLTLSGMSDAERDAWTANPSLILGKIVEVEAMGLSTNGSLREPRYKGVRYDKLHPDF